MLLTKTGIQEVNDRLSLCFGRIVTTTTTTEDGAAPNFRAQQQQQ